ncbi:HEPN domain-containing protein [Blastopirellula marina]|uniref:DNA-binding protein n=1 Tax=Blastopirellula marina TaxID=124 RepID=A0A2S8GG08_9BACT|nr:HEPN domain-containing protein [Blastopirellula marina]PQO43406.1 DNA-binding protein [Blastopirellula marina]
MNRSQFQALAEERLLDSEALLHAGQWSGAYYLSGYAVECGLKACIAKLTLEHDFPRERAFIEKCYSHDLEKLVGAAGLTKARADDMDANSVLGNNWLVAKDWNEQARYQVWSETQAKKLVDAVTDSKNGVLIWVKTHW